MIRLVKSDSHDWNKYSENDILRASFPNTAALQATKLLPKYVCGTRRDGQERETERLQGSTENAGSTIYAQGLVLKNFLIGGS